MPDIHSFSDGYYLVNGFYVEPSDDVTHPAIQDHVYAEIQEQYYGQFSTPILFRHNGAQYHFQIEPASSVPSDTIAVPFDLLRDMGIEIVPSQQEFLMAKPGHAKTLVEFSNPAR